MARPVGSHVEKGVTNAPQIVRSAMGLRGYTLKMLASSLGYSGPKSTWGLLQPTRNMQINVFVAMMDALGFDIIVKDRNGSNRENTWKLEQIPDEEEGE